VNSFRFLARARRAKLAALLAARLEDLVCNGGARIAAWIESLGS
jgi:hypothetical protein